jgi:hypothetical protein
MLNAGLHLYTDLYLRLLKANPEVETATFPTGHDRSGLGILRGWYLIAFVPLLAGARSPNLKAALTLTIGRYCLYLYVLPVLYPTDNTTRSRRSYGFRGRA